MGGDAMTGQWGWRAQVTDDWYGGIDNVRVQFARPHGPTELEYLVGFEDGGGNGTARPVFAVELVAATPEFRGFLIPREAVEALAEQVKPGPSQGEVKRLEEALTVERTRVDRWIEQGAVPSHRVAPTDRGADVVALILSDRAAEFVRSVLVAFDGPESGNKLAAEVVEAIDGRTS
jgi:ribosomal protein S16